MPLLFRPCTLLVFCLLLTDAVSGASTDTVYNYASMISALSSKTCTQSTDPRCTSAALKALIKGEGIKAAYCNDAFLVLHTDGTTAYSNYLSSIKNRVTKDTNSSCAIVKIPLVSTLLTTADPAINNINIRSFPGGGTDGIAAHMSTATPNNAATYGLPTRGNYFLLELTLTLTFQG